MDNTTDSSDSCATQHRDLALFKAFKGHSGLQEEVFCAFYLKRDSFTLSSVNYEQFYDRAFLSQAAPKFSTIRSLLE